MDSEPAAPLSKLVRRINSIALSTIDADGTHAAMFFLRLPDGAVEPRLFATAADPPGAARAQELADAVGASPADAVVFVSEARSARAEDILLVAGLDRLGNQLVLETTLSRDEDGGLTPAGTDAWGPEYVVHALDGVRAVWGLPGRIAFRDGAFSVTVPPDWIVAEDEDTVQLEPPSRRGAAHFSVYRRGERREPADGEATDFPRGFARSLGVEDLDVTERLTARGRVAVASFAEPDGDPPRGWFVGADLSPLRAVLYTYNDDGSDRAARDCAAAIFATLEVGVSRA